MLQILIAILYITFICFSWGWLGLSLVNKWRAESFAPALPICCLFGLSIIGIVSQAASIFIPMGGWLIQLFLLLPALYLFFKSAEFRTASLGIFKKPYTALNLPGRFFLISGMVYICVVGAWYISNPDTLGYHAPIIEWNEQYKVIPGITNLNGRLGLQSSWFILAALFNFSFTGTTALTFINSTILSWLVLFLADQLSRIYQHSPSTSRTFLIWTLLCLSCFGVNVQVYLTAASASPDFVICIFLWTCLYLLIQHNGVQKNTSSIILALIILSFSVSLKISALPALILLPLIFLKLTPLKKNQRFLLLGFIPALAILPFMYRSFITSGYPLFPSFYFDFFAADWKADPIMTRQIDEYVTIYARTGFVTIVEYADYATMPFKAWFPSWLEQYTMAEKLLTFSSLIAAFINLVFVKFYFQKINRTLGYIVGVCLVCGIFLMLKAPAPRFSQAFLVPIILAAVFLLTEKFPVLQPAKWLRLPILLLLFLPITGYSAYRFYRYFDLVNFWKPYGIANEPLQSIECNGMKVYLPSDPNGCGDASLPCANNPCKTFIPRGKRIEDGFKARIN